MKTMGWFSNRKKKITKEQLAENLYYLANKFGKEYVSLEISSGRCDLKGVDEDVYAHENVIMSFWIIFVLLLPKAYNTEVMNLIHKEYLYNKGSHSDPEESKKETSFIIARYEEYSNEFKGDMNNLLHVIPEVFAKNIMQSDTFVLNYHINTKLAIDLSGRVKLFGDLINEFEVIN